MAKKTPPVRQSTKITIRYNGGATYVANNVTNYGFDEDSTHYMYETERTVIEDGVQITTSTSVTIPVADLDRVVLQLPYGIINMIDISEYLRALKHLGE